MIYQTADAFDRIIEHMKTVKPGSEEHQTCVAELETIARIQNEVYHRLDKESWTGRILGNAPLVTGIFGFVTTVVVLQHERLEIITSRAFNWIRFR